MNQHPSGRPPGSPFDDGAQTSAPIAGIESLRRDREPEHDLWPGIAARIAATAQLPAEAAPARRRPVRWPLALAAGLVAAMAGVIGVQRLQTGDARPLAAPAPPVAIAPGPQPAAAGAAVAVATPALQGPNRALVKANLKIVASAEAQLRQALATDPDAVYLQNLMASAQAQRQQLRGLLDDRGDAGHDPAGAGAGRGQT